MASLGTLWGASPLNADDASRLLFTVDTDLQTLTRALDNTPFDFATMDTVSWEVQWRANLNSGGGVDDSLGLEVRVMNGATVLAAADSSGGWATVKATSGTFTTTDTTVGPTSFAYVNTTANKSTWDGASIELRQRYTKNKGADSVRIEVDFARLTGTYTLDAGTRTGTAAQTMPSPVAQDASGTHVPPTFSGPAAQTMPSPVLQDASGFYAPNRSGTAAQTMPSPVGQSATANAYSTKNLNIMGTSYLGSGLMATSPTMAVAEGAPQSYSGPAAQTMPFVSQSAAGTYTPPDITGTIAQSMPSVAQSALGTNADPVFSGSIAQSMPVRTQDATGTYTPPTSTGPIAQAMPLVTQDAAGTFSLEFVGPIDQSMPSVTQSAAGSFDPGTFTATGDQTMPSPVLQDGAGSHVPPTFTATGDQTMPSVTQSAAGTNTDPTYSGPLAQTMPSVGQSASGSVDNPGFSGPLSQTVPFITQSAAGTHTDPFYSGAISQTFWIVSQDAAGTFDAGLYEGIIAQTMPSVGQSASGTFTETVIGAVLDALAGASTLSGSGTVDISGTLGADGAAHQFSAVETVSAPGLYTVALAPGVSLIVSRRMVRIGDPPERAT